MHLVESYATNCGVKIDKPFIYEKFYPIDKDNYIVFHPVSKDAKTYTHWQTTLDILRPWLEAEGISLVQVGAPKERPYSGCIVTNGSTDVNQVAYLLRHSKLLLGVDSFPAHIASSMDKKMVILYPNCNLSNVGPYWGNKNNQVLLKGEIEGQKPAYSFEERPKSIDTIKPEDIAKEVCRLLDIKMHYPYETLFMGNGFHIKTIENLPNQVVNPKSMGRESIIVRMDLLFNEELLAQQLQESSATIVTNKPIDTELINFFKKQIKEIIYFIEEDDDPDFAAFLESSGLEYSLLSFLPEDQLQPKKMNYLDLEKAALLPMTRESKENIKEIKNVDVKDLYFMTSTVFLSAGQAFASEQHWLDGDPLTRFDEIKQVKDTPVFWRNAHRYLILKKLD